MVLCFGIKMIEQWMFTALVILGACLMRSVFNKPINEIINSSNQLMNHLRILQISEMNKQKQFGS